MIFILLFFNRRRSIPGNKLHSFLLFRGILWSLLVEVDLSFIDIPKGNRLMPLIFISHSIDVILCHRPLGFKNLLRRDSSIDIDGEAIFNKLFIFFSHIDIGIKEVFNWSVSHHLEQNFIIFVSPRHPPIHKLKGNDSKTPDITFIGIAIIF